MTRPKPTPTLNTPEPGILSKSGLDVTLESINKELESINHKLDNAPTKEKVEQVEEENQRLREEFEAYQKEADGKFASKSRFELIEKAVLTVAGLIVTGVVGALLALVLK